MKKRNHRIYTNDFKTDNEAYAYANKLASEGKYVTLFCGSRDEYEKQKIKILYLTLKRKYFDMIASKEKPEEYREIKKYWIKRLTERFVCIPNGLPFRKYDIVRFRNGYNKTSPTMDIEFKGIIIGKGKKKWGAPNKNVFIIKLGEIKFIKY